MQPILKEADFRRELKDSPRTGYLFFGDEDYLKAFALSQARRTVSPDPTFAFFNDLRIDAVDFTPDKLLDALMPMPMMADRKVVTLTGLNFNTMRPGELDELCDACGALAEYDYNLLIVYAAADCLDPGYLPKKPSSTLTKLSEYLTPVQFDRCTGAKLAAWIQKHFLHNGIEASPAFCTEMPNYCGHSMYVLAGEIDKLSYYALSHGRKTVTVEEMHLVCTPVNEFDGFAFTNAMMDGKQELALAILADYRVRRVEPISILGEVVSVACDMMAVHAMTADGHTPADISAALNVHAFRVGLYQKSLRGMSEKRLRRFFDACLAADASLKQSTTKGYAPLERLICSL